MQKNNRLMIIALAIIVVLFFYFGNDALSNNGTNGMMTGNGMMQGSNWKWLPTIVTLFFGIIIGWIIYKKK